MGLSLKYIWLLVFQLLLVILFFVFVKYDGANDVNIKGYEDTHVMIYIGFGFLMTFLKKYCYGALGINWLLAALVAQWSIITQGVFHMHEKTIHLNKKMILEADVMAATVLITFGALLGRASVNQLLLIAIIEAAVGSANLYLVTDVFQETSGITTRSPFCIYIAADVGGSIAIHTYGAFFGIAVSAAWINRRAVVQEPSSPASQEGGEGHPLEGPSYESDVTSMIGSIFLFIYWPSFNAALTGSPADYQRAIVNTYLSLASCSVVTFVLSSLVSHGKFEMEHIQNSTLAGGVGVGSVCNMHLTAGGALVVGIGAAFLSVFGFSKFKPFFIRKCRLLDTCGVMHLHGFPGVYSGLVSIVVAALASEDVYGLDLFTVFEAMKEGRSSEMQAVYQLAALLCTILIALVFGLITGFITKLKIFGPVKKAEQFDDEKFWEVPA